MFKRAGCSVACLMALATMSWADEPIAIRPRPGLKQRVDPKLLKEVLNIPEYPAVTPETTAQMLEDLQAVSDKLRKNSDLEAADLLDRFIGEHRRLIQHLQTRAIAPSEQLLLTVKPVEVNLDRVSGDSILLKDPATIRDKSHADVSRLFEGQLERLIELKHARSLVAPHLKVRSDDAPARVPVDEFAIDLSARQGTGNPSQQLGGTGTTTIEFREFGVLIEVLPTHLDEGRIRLQALCQFKASETGSRIVATKVQETFEINPGESAVQCSAMSPDGHHKLFLIYKLVRRI